MASPPVDFLRDTLTGFKSALHPAPHRRRVFAGEMNPPFRPPEMRIECQHLSWPQVRDSATCPGIGFPDFHGTELSSLC